MGGDHAVMIEGIDDLVDGKELLCSSRGPIPVLVTAPGPLVSALFEPPSLKLELVPLVGQDLVVRPVKAKETEDAEQYLG
jgi:hypothetical protein